MSVVTETKSEFARRCGVDPSQVTRWIAASIIGPDAIEGEGRSARIVVDRALPQIERRRDPGQALGNGAKTKLGAAHAPADAVLRPALMPSDTDFIAGEQTGDGAPEPDAEDYNAQKTRLAKAQADAQEMKNALARGEMEHADNIRQRWCEIALRFRSCMLAVVGRVRDAAPHLSPSDIAIVDTEIRRGLKDASLGPSS